MSAVNLQEPSTKFFGPSVGYFLPPPASRIHLTLHNLEPGDLWNPTHAAELATTQILTPLLDFQAWRFRSTNYVWTYHHYPLGHWYGGNFYIGREEISVVGPNRTPWVFSMYPLLGVHKWCRNRFRDPVAVAAFNGTCTFSYQEN